MNEKLILGIWAECKHLAAPLRKAVFVDEQGVPAELEWDAEDELCLHAVLMADDGAATATGRLLPVFEGGDDTGLCRIGRMAVRRSLRGQGRGAQVLDALVMASRLRRDAGVLLHAQTSAQGFYAGRGFVSRGEIFDEAGIPHIEMVLRF